MSVVVVWAGEAVEQKVPDDKATSASSQGPMQMAGVAPSPEAPLAMELEGSSEHLLELIVDNLRQLGPSSQGAFLQRLLRGLTSVEVTEKDSIVHWESILARRNELTQKLGRPSSLRTAAVDYFGELRLLRKPILLEYEELEKLRHSAATDPLTGLRNRRMFEEYLAREINRSSRYGTSFALLLLDLRKFKLANDTYGHATGDEILRSVARATVETMRGSDISCRIGGDEFAILLPQIERSGAEALAERIARKFEVYAKPLAPDTPVGVDYGIGIFPEDGKGATKLFLSADKSLYESKQRASRPLEPGASAQGSAPEVEGRVREADGARDTGDRRRSASSVSSPDLGLAGEEIQPSEHIPDRRSYERVRVEGARRLGVVRFGEKSKVVKLRDLGLGGVCLLIDDGEVPDSFSARLQVPFLPGVELTLHRVYSLQLPERRKRVGCSFTPTSAPGTG